MDSTFVIPKSGVSSSHANLHEVLHAEVAINNVDSGEHVGDVGTTKVSTWKRRAKAQGVSARVVESSPILSCNGKRLLEEETVGRDDVVDGPMIKRRNNLGDVSEINCLSVKAIAQPRRSQ